MNVVTKALSWQLVLVLLHFFDELVVRAERDGAKLFLQDRCNVLSGKRSCLFASMSVEYSIHTIWYFRTCNSTTNLLVL